MAKTKGKTKTIPWDFAAYLKTDEDIADYLEAVCLFMRNRRMS